MKKRFQVESCYQLEKKLRVVQCISSAELAQAFSYIKINLTFKVRFSELKSNECIAIGAILVS
jgi:hypothetical protein